MTNLIIMKNTQQQIQETQISKDQILLNSKLIKADSSTNYENQKFFLKIQSSTPLLNKKLPKSHLAVLTITVNQLKKNLFQKTRATSL